MVGNGFKTSPPNSKLVTRYLHLATLGTSVHPVRNNAPLLPPGQRPSGPAAAAGLDFRIIPAGFNAPLEFLTGFTLIEVLLIVEIPWASMP